MEADQIFEVTPTAAEKLKELARKQGLNVPTLRVKVVSGGCAGMTYQMDFSKEPPGEKDIVWETRGVKVVLDPMAALYVMNSELDYQEGLMGSGFKIKNPNAKASCACGESFYV
ncbi:MAG: HesB/IscA family protein [Thermoplasmata archaeon]